MATLGQHNKLPSVNLEKKTDIKYTGSADFQPNLPNQTQSLTVSYFGDTGCVQRVIEADFENWDDQEKMELIKLLTKFCTKSLEERHGIR